VSKRRALFDERCPVGFIAGGGLLDRGTDEAPIPMQEARIKLPTQNSST
jgi:hypothetical protein